MIETKKRMVEEDTERPESMVRARIEELTELTTHLFKVHEDERRSLARELHDELGSILTAAKLDITFIKSKFASANPALIAKCDRIASMLDQGAALKRRLIDNLRPSTLDMLGLAPAVRELVENFATESHLETDVNVDADIDHRNDAALTVYRVIEEALRNVNRHADATKIRVTLEHAGSQLHVAVADNGAGFDPLAGQTANGHGLSAMKQRIRALGGKMQVVSGLGSGTEVDAWLPFRPD